MTIIFLHTLDILFIFVYVSLIFNIFSLSNYTFDQIFLGTFLTYDHDVIDKYNSTSSSLVTCILPINDFDLNNRRSEVECSYNL